MKPFLREETNSLAFWPPTIAAIIIGQHLMRDSCAKSCLVDHDGKGHCVVERAHVEYFDINGYPFWVCEQD